MEAAFHRPARRVAMSLARHPHQHQVTRTFVFGFGYKLAKKVTPKISPTEAAALDAGTVGFDRELFGGNPSLQQLKTKYDLKVGTATLLVLVVGWEVMSLRIR